ncbi:hypothetical protein ES319_D07G176300v1 [Gossypium barbadense]|uniref:Uncharacterized protein n=2 Tax=Gossypium TaxID=3633 RepID=A0A5J5QVD9_GOSBA|nr:hypothetical protein ES319_D07G176300v1 [Gossypium barbadense]TYG61925.1 hypothetical protein ES288_D07G188400v1 [Gossypium darwinii]
MSGLFQKDSNNFQEISFFAFFYRFIFSSSSLFSLDFVPVFLLELSEMLKCKVDFEALITPS